MTQWKPSSLRFACFSAGAQRPAVVSLFSCGGLLCTNSGFHIYRQISIAGFSECAAMGMEQPWAGSELAVADAGDGSKCSVPICADYADHAAPTSPVEFQG